MNRLDRARTLATLIVCAAALLVAVRADAGAWTDIYDYGDRAAGVCAGEQPDPRACALADFKIELTFRGYGKSLDLSVLAFGDAMRNRVRELQADQQLPVTGRIDSTTSRRLFRMRVYAAERTRGIVNHLVCRLLQLESAYDPAATGWVNPDDRGLGQINARFHPDVSDVEAFDARFSIRWTADRLLDAYQRFQNWRVALAAHNVGYGGAQAWLDDGMPTESTTGRYVQLVLSRPC